MERYSCLNECDCYSFHMTMNYEFETSFFYTYVILLYFVIFLLLLSQVTHRVQSQLVWNLYFILVWFFYLFSTLFFFLFWYLIWTRSMLFFLGIFQCLSSKITRKIVLFFVPSFDIIILFIQEFPSRLLFHLHYVSCIEYRVLNVFSDIITIFQLCFDA